MSLRLSPTQDAALIGQQVLVPGTSLALASGHAGGAFTLPQSTSVTNIVIKNSAGATVKTIQLGAEAAGTVPFTWDGSTDSGAAAAAGNYSYAISATSGTASVTASTLSQGAVTAVVPGVNGASPSLTVAASALFPCRKSPRFSNSHCIRNSHELSARIKRSDRCFTKPRCDRQQRCQFGDRRLQAVDHGIRRSLFGRSGQCRPDPGGSWHRRGRRTARHDTRRDHHNRQSARYGDQRQRFFSDDR